MYNISHVWLYDNQFFVFVDGSIFKIPILNETFFSIQVAVTDSSALSTKAFKAVLNVEPSSRCNQPTPFHPGFSAPKRGKKHGL